MNFNKFCFLITFCLFLIFTQVLMEESSSADQKSLLEAVIKNDENNNSEINKNDNNNNLNKATDIVERGLVGDIEKLLKVAEILQTVGQKVIPSILTTNPTNTGIETEVDVVEPTTVLGTKGIHDGLFHIRELKKNVGLIN